MGFYTIFFGLSVFSMNLQKSLAFTQQQNCGISTVSGVGDRIVGGREAIPGEYPWLASLRYKVLFVTPTHLCGAAILNEYWVLTAAHCVHRRSKRNFSLAIGLYSQDDRKITSHSIDKIITHDKFNPDTFLNDIALIRVAKPIIFNNFVAGICLPVQDSIAKGIATAAGWGAVYEDGESSSVMLAVDLPIVPTPICEDLFGSDFSPSAMMCAGYPEGGKDTCQGDSGGPLMQRINGTFVVVGIVSFGMGCARPQLPGIYTRVANYIPWIKTKTK